MLPRTNSFVNVETDLRVGRLFGTAEAAPYTALGVGDTKHTRRFLLGDRVGTARGKEVVHFMNHSGRSRYLSLSATEARIEGV